MTPSPPNARPLAEWVCGFKLGSPSGPVAAKTRDLITDFLGVALAGAAEEDSARVALDYAIRSGGRGEATLLRRGAPKVPAELAAFAHACAGHSVEMDDVHNASSAHPGAATIPAALAVAEAEGRDGLALVEAVVAGYEMILRVGEAAGPSKVYARGFHPTAVCGVFSSAAAAGRLMGLSVDQMIHAFGLAWSFAGGSMSFQAEGSWAKRMQVGNAARVGVQAARLASIDATGPSHVFEPHGFFASYGGGPDVARLLGGLGGVPKIMETGIKPFACCRYIQAPLDCLLELKAEHRLEPDRIERVEIEIASTGLPLVAIPAEAKRSPRDAVEAQFSVYYSAAVALIAGRAGREQYRAPWLGDSKVLDLAQRVSCRSSPEIDRKFPALWPARVVVTLKTGERLERATDHCLGDPEKPMSREQLCEKFVGLASATFDESTASGVLDLLEGVASALASPTAGIAGRM